MEPQSKKACLGNYTKLLFDTLKNLLQQCSEDVNQVHIEVCHVKKLTISFA
jgi:hypothetical protein